MKKWKRLLLFALVYMSATLVFALTRNLSFASEPVGDWQVEEASAHIRIAICGDKLWGIVAWERTPNGLDSNNPDPTLRSRPTLGIPILLGLTRSGSDRWGGEIYNADDGRTYKARVQATNPNVLRVEGCVLGLLCGSQTWTRVLVSQSSPAPVQAGAKPAHIAPAQSPARGPAPRLAQGAQQRNASPIDDVCAAVAAAN